MKRGRLVILLVEDDDKDIYFVRRATESGTAGHQVLGVHDGEEAILCLKGVDQYADRQRFPIPNVVLTDIKMPGMSGFELLCWLRGNPQYGIIPTIVYSSSKLETDVRKAYTLGANSYITKPASVTELVDILRVMYEYWSRCECPALPNRVPS